VMPVSRLCKGGGRHQSPEASKAIDIGSMALEALEGCWKFRNASKALNPETRTEGVLDNY